MIDAAAPVEARRFLIDALNVAHWCGRTPSLRLPLTLMVALLQEGHVAQLVFDASTRYRLPEDERAIYAALLHLEDTAIEAPSGRSADGLLLRQARASGAGLISRDHFADHRRRYRKLIDDPARRHTGGLRDGRLCIPTLGIAVTLPASAAPAWQQLQMQARPTSSAAARGTTPAVTPVARAEAA